MTQEIIDKIIELKQLGKTYKEIQDITGCCKNTCIKYLKLTGNFDYKPIVDITPELLEQIQERYNKVGNIKKIAKEFGVSYGRLRKSGIQLNKPVKTLEQINKLTRYSKKIKEQLIEYKGGKCEICDYNKYFGALEFHHLNSYNKDFSISGGTKSFEKLKPEVDKCILVCSNCHREIHGGLINL